MKWLGAAAVLVCVVILANMDPALGKGRPTQGCAQAQDNDGGTYDSTCDGQTSTRARQVDGSRGAADNRDPRGQQPNGAEDGDAGYECDRNAGHPNPAQTGCAVPASPTPTPTESSEPTPTPEPSLTHDRVLPKCLGDSCGGLDTHRFERGSVLPATGLSARGWFFVALVLILAGAWAIRPR